MKKQVLSIIIVIVYLVALVGYVSYSLLTEVIHNENNLQVEETIGNGLTVTSMASSENMLVTANINKGNVGSVMAYAASALYVNLDAGDTSTRSNTAIVTPGCCSYDIIWEWEQTSNTNNQYHKSSGATLEYTLSGSLKETSGEFKTWYNGNDSFEVQLPDYNASSLSNVVHHAQICNDFNVAPAAKELQAWNLETKFYNLDVNQDNFIGASFAGKAKIGNVSCQKTTYTVANPLNGYWYAASTLNDNTNQYEPQYTFPNHGGILHATGEAIGKSSYIGQNNSKYYVCIGFSGREICLSQPYTQYGLSGHTPCTSSTCYFTSAQVASVDQAIKQLLATSGFKVPSDRTICTGTGNIFSKITCSINYFTNGVNNYFTISSTDGSINANGSGGQCYLTYDGKAYCN